MQNDDDDDDDDDDNDDDDDDDDDDDAVVAGFHSMSRSTNFAVQQRHPLRISSHSSKGASAFPSRTRLFSTDSPCIMRNESELKDLRQSRSTGSQCAFRVAQ